MIFEFFCRIIKFLQTSILGLFFFLNIVVYGQDIKIIRVNASQYPLIKATFQATNAKGEKVIDAKPSDFNATENKAACKIIEVTNPKEIAVPASILLVLDVSRSMAGERLLLAKKAAKAFIEHVPLETSEIAIASFSDEWLTL